MTRLFDLERTRKLMKTHNIEILVASSMDNFGYLTTYWPPSGKYKDIGWTGNPILSLAAIPLEKNVEPFLLTSWYRDDVDYENPWIKDRRYYGSPAEGISKEGGIFEEFSMIIEENGLGKSRIGLELGYNAYTIEIASSMMVEKLRNLLPDAKFKDASVLLREMRLIKTDEEINRIKKAADISERAIKASFEEVTGGMTEIELERIIRRNLAECDVEAALVGINFGEDDILRPTDKKLEKGDYVRIDLAVKYKQYFGDVTRTAVFGEPSAGLQRVYNSLSRIHDVTLSMLKPGAKCSGIYNAAKKLLRESGITYEPPLVAHGTGICVHEGPYVNDNDTTVQPGMTLAVEIVEKMGKGSYVTIEDMVICDAQGCTDVTTLPKELIRI
jgi:Xaa-Pro dipeptidase